MTHNPQHTPTRGGHRIVIAAVLCLFGLCLAFSHTPPRGKGKPRPKTDERIYLVHADELFFEQYGPHPDAQILRGKVSFKHKGATLTCDSAYFYEATNSFDAYGHVNMRQGDTLRLVSEFAHYDGDMQMAYASRNVVLTHRATKLYTDSLIYDRLYEQVFYPDGGKMIDKNNVLESRTGVYFMDTRQAQFNGDVVLVNPKYRLETSALDYDMAASTAFIVAPTDITSGESVIHTSSGNYNTSRDVSRLYDRSTIVNKNKTITGDTLFYDKNSGVSEGFGNVVYQDSENKNQLFCDYFWYNEQTGQAYATKRALMVDYSQKDTLYMHADSLKLYTFNINTDSVWRRVHCFNHVRAYRTDVQAVCDSLVYNTQDSCMTMYKDPIAWYGPRQLLGEKIEVYMNDSTIDWAHVVGQAFSVEKADEEEHYNQVSSTEMFAFFDEGAIRRSDAVGSVRAIYYPVDDKDSSLIVMDYTETDTLRMFMRDRKMHKIWTNRAEGTWYPLTQIPPAMKTLAGFAWFDYIRPVDKDDIFVWRGKSSGTELRKVERHSAPLQTLPPVHNNEATMPDEPVQAQTSTTLSP